MRLDWNKFCFETFIGPLLIGFALGAGLVLSLVHYRVIGN